MDDWSHRLISAERGPVEPTCRTIAPSLGSWTARNQYPPPWPLISQADQNASSVLDPTETKCALSEAWRHIEIEISSSSSRYPARHARAHPFTETRRPILILYISFNYPHLPSDFVFFIFDDDCLSPSITNRQIPNPIRYGQGYFGRPRPSIERGPFWCIFRELVRLITTELETTGRNAASCTYCR